MLLDVTMDDRRTLSKPIKIKQKDPITLPLAILVEVEETQNVHNQAPSYRPM